MSQSFFARNRRHVSGKKSHNRKPLLGAIAVASASLVCVGWNQASAATASDATISRATTPKLAISETTTHSSAAISGALSSTRNASVMTAPAMWATYKGDAQRTGAVNMSARWPLNLQWRYSSDAEPGAIVGSPLVVGATGARRVLFNAGKFLYCLNAETGENIWTWTADSALRAPLSLLSNGDAVLALSSKGRAQAIRVSDGATLWKYQSDSALKVAPLLLRTTRGERIVLAPSSGVLVALTTAGAIDATWRVALGASGAAPVAAPVANANGDRIFVAADDGAVYAIDVRTARVAFSTTLDAASTAPPVVVGNMAVAIGNSLIVAVRTDNGSTLWRAAAGDGESFSSLSAQPATISAPAVIYAGTNRGALLAFGARDGKQLWKSSLGRASLSGAPLVLSNALLVGSRNGVIYGVDKTKGQLLWRYRLESERRVLVPVRQLMTTNGGTGSAPSSPFGSPYVAGGGGFGRPGAGSAAATPTPVPMTYETHTFGTSAAPAAVDGVVYLPADNAALYAFSVTGFDASPPLISEPTIVIPDTLRQPYDVAVTSDFPGIANKGPVSLTLQLSDAGSGIDASRLRATYDGQALPATDVKYDASSGVLSLAIFKPRGDVTTLNDGTHTVNVEVADYNGNSAQNTTSFKVDSTFVSPTPKVIAGASTQTTQPQQPTFGGWRGGGRGGGWDPSQGPPPWRRGRYEQGS